MEGITHTEFQFKGVDLCGAVVQLALQVCHVVLLLSESTVVAEDKLHAPRRQTTQ